MFSKTIPLLSLLKSFAFANLLLTKSKIYSKSSNLNNTHQFYLAKYFLSDVFLSDFFKKITKIWPKLVCFVGQFLCLKIKLSLILLACCHNSSVGRATDS